MWWYSLENDRLIGLVTITEGVKVGWWARDMCIMILTVTKTVNEMHKLKHTVEIYNRKNYKIKIIFNN